MTIVSHCEPSQLRAILRGPVWTPEDPGFEELHRPWNRAVEQPALAVVEAADADDVARLLQWAGANSVRVATQPSGHGATGRATGAVLLRTTRLNRIEIDPAARTARIGSGVLSGSLQREAALHGLTALPGSSPVVSVTGAALGGGLSWFSRAFGWMADSILGADVVTADGTLRHVTPSTEPELFWALGGGGGDVVVVTALELRLHRAPKVFGGRQLWPATHARAVAEVHRAMTQRAPDELTLWLELLSFPGADPMVAIDSTFLGAEDTSRALMRATEALPTPLSDTRAPICVADLGLITAEPTSPSAGKSRGELLTELSDDALNTLLEDPISPLLSVQVRHLGGALTRPTENPHGALSEPYAIYMFGVPTTSEVAESIGRRQASLAARLPTSGRKAITFLNASEQLGDALPPSSLARLGLLKKERDPLGVISGNFATPQGAAGGPRATQACAESCADHGSGQ